MNMKAETRLYFYKPRNIKDCQQTRQGIRQLWREQPLSPTLGFHPAADLGRVERLKACTICRLSLRKTLQSYKHESLSSGFLCFIKVSYAEKIMRFVAAEAAIERT